MRSRRPPPDEVLAWFEREIDEQSLKTILATLEADPNWAVFTRRVPDEVEIEGHYVPTGVRLFMRLTQVVEDGAAVWRGAL